MGIGTLAPGYQVPVLGSAVQKTGRTTAHSFGTVVAVDVQVDVKYDSGTARFFGQTRIRHLRYACDGASFSAGGDSGSLIVSVPGPDDAGAQAVGLLFAGSSSDTIANPMEMVFREFQTHNGLNLEMVSGSPPATDPAAMLEAYNGQQCAPSDGGSGGGGGKGGRPRQQDAADAAGLDVARAVQARNSAAIFAMPNVVGHGIGRADDGRAVIEIYVATRAPRVTYPSQIEGVPVRVIQTGEFRAF